VALTRAFGCARVVFNDALAARQAAHAAGEPYLSDAAMSARLTASKQVPERAWLGEVSAAVLQQALADLNTAYRNFFDSMTGKRKGPRVSAPRFRSRKDSRQAIRFTANARFKVTGNGRLRLPKIGDVPVRWSRTLPAVPTSVTVIRDAAGRFFASFVVEVSPALLPDTGRECGIDLGLGHFAVRMTARRSPPRVSCGALKRNSSVRTGTCPASRKGQRTGTRPGCESRGRTLGWPIRAGTSTTSSPPGSSAKIKR
jgi:putative transposase